MGKMLGHGSVYPRTVHDYTYLLTHIMNKQVCICMPESSCYRWYNHPIYVYSSKCGALKCMQWIDQQSVTMNRQSTSPIVSIHGLVPRPISSFSTLHTFFFSISSFSMLHAFQCATLKSWEWVWEQGY